MSGPFGTVAYAPGGGNGGAFGNSFATAAFAATVYPLGLAASGRLTRQGGPGGERLRAERAGLTWII